MWIILPLFGSPLMTALTAAAWYSGSVLFGLPAVDPEKIGAIVCLWAVVITVGFWALILWHELRSS